MVQVYAIFEEGTPQSIIDSVVKEHHINAYWIGIPPFLKAEAEEEGWVLPHFIKEVLEEI